MLTWIIIALYLKSGALMWQTWICNLFLLLHSSTEKVWSMQGWTSETGLEGCLCPVLLLHFWVLSLNWLWSLCCYMIFFSMLQSVFIFLSLRRPCVVVVWYHGVSSVQTALHWITSDLFVNQEWYVNSLARKSRHIYEVQGQLSPCRASYSILSYPFRWHGRLKVVYYRLAW